MVKKKGKSKRVTLKQKFKIQTRVKEHDRKVRKAAKRNPNKGETRKSRDPGIPNSWPQKADLLDQIAAARVKLDLKRRRPNPALSADSVAELAASAKSRASNFNGSTIVNAGSATVGGAKDAATAADGAEADGAEDDRRVNLMSQEGDQFEVEVKVAKMSELVKTMIPEEADEDDEEAQEIPLPNVKSHVLAKVIEFCR
mmetsp:Transcript_8350/g.29478  ORF Transcript_8350/g.29478 Transcript_8350/m.29478 type:complete len:199 (-) Transcript_8350:622-1218(-)